jgi:hypothetical protein
MHLNYGANGDAGMYLSLSAPQRIFFPQPLTRVETGRSRGVEGEPQKALWSGISGIERSCSLVSRAPVFFTTLDPRKINKGDDP